jgi:tetratricopeptide (TPR) repeat protein
MRWLPVLLLLTPSMLLAQELVVVGQERLALAIRLFRSGDYAQARATLINLLNDPAVEDLDLRINARVYLGEVLLAQNDRNAALEAFRTILDDDPEHQLDPYEHPPDVVEFFDMVRAATRDLAPDDPPPPLPPPIPPPPELEPMHWTGYAPFGVHQLRQKRYGWFTILAVGQLGTMAGSLGTAIPLYMDHEGYDDEYPGLVTMRNWNWALTGAFWGLWITGTVEASVRWRSDQRAAMKAWEEQHTSSELMLGPGTVGWEIRF